MDILFIEKLIVMTMIGIHTWEKKCLQKLIFDIELAYDKTRLNNNHLSSYLDYTRVRQLILSIVSEKHFLLIEDVAEITARAVIRDFCVYWVRVIVRKPSAMHDAASVGVCIKRKSEKFYV